MAGRKGWMCRVQRAPSRGHWSRVPDHKGWVKLTQVARQCPAPNVPAVTSRHKLNKGSCLNHQSWVPLTPTSRLSPSVCLSTPLLFMAPRMFLILEYSLSWHKPCALMRENHVRPTLCLSRSRSDVTPKLSTNYQCWWRGITMQGTSLNLISTVSW